MQIGAGSSGIESGKGILLNAGSRYIKIENGNIEIGCPDLIELKAE